MPAYNDLIKDAHASVTVYRYVGDDLVITAQADRSALVNACGAVGSVGGSAGAVGAAAVLAGMALPAVAKARENARDVRSMVVLRSIGQGFNVYAADQKDALPTSVDDLVKAQYVTHDMLRSPFGPAPGGSDYWVNPRGGKISAIDDPAHYVIAYDRAMAQSQKRIAVAFLDGHVENLTPEQFRELTQSDGNKGVDFDLP
jgi:prepilin-type processing-associated H-X9-DG protein